MSDARRIKNAKPIVNATQNIVKLKPVEAKVKEVPDDVEQPFRATLVAQDVMQHFPDLVFKNDPADDGKSELPQGRGRFGGGLMVARADAWIPYLIASIIELDARLKALETP